MHSKQRTPKMSTSSLCMHFEKMAQNFRRSTNPASWHSSLEPHTVFLWVFFCMCLCLQASFSAQLRFPKPLQLTLYHLKETLSCNWLRSHHSEVLYPCMDLLITPITIAPHEGILYHRRYLHQWSHPAARRRTWHWPVFASAPVFSTRLGVRSNKQQVKDTLRDQTILKPTNAASIYERWFPE